MTGNRIYGLDILRAFAILFVVFGHGYNLITNHVTVPGYFFPILDGVTLFFVLSGFLIGGILLKEIHRTEFEAKDLFNFWKRRWFRTLPNYVLLLTIMLVLRLVMHLVIDKPMPLSTWETIKYYLFLQSFAEPHPNFFPELWSLCVEEWFYLLIPFSLFLIINYVKIDKKNAVVLVIGIVILAVTIFRFYRAGTVDLSDQKNWILYMNNLVVTRLDSIMFGVLGAFVKWYYPERWKQKIRLLFFLGISILFYSHFNDLFGDRRITIYWSLTLAPIGTLLMLPFLDSVQSGKGFIHRWITHISIISYSMYLLNLTPIQFYLMPFMNKALHIPKDHTLTSDAFQYLLFWLLTIVLSTMLYRYFEKPATALREKKIFR